MVVGILCIAVAALGVTWFQLHPPKFGADGFHVNTSDDAVDARAFLTNQIFGGSPMLSDSSRSLVRIDCEPGSNIFCGMFDNVSKVDELTVTMEFGLTSLVTLFTPTDPRNVVTIYHRGHAGPSVFTPDLVPSINSLLSAGHTVAIIAMPLYPPNKSVVTVGDVVLSTHDDFGMLPRSTPSSELKFYLQPVFHTVEELSTRHPDWRIQMTGLSGGGWTTVLAAAIDTRIDHSVSIAGSTPMTSWTPTESVDREQTLPGIAGRLDYDDLYVLMTHPNRTATLVYNTQDPCCFAPGDAPWSWDEEVTSRVQGIGGALSIVYQTSTLHDIGTEGLKAMLLVSAE
jgi:hypothetical protein